jgi:hypothetical protein
VVREDWRLGRLWLGRERINSIAAPPRNTRIYVIALKDDIRMFASLSSL